MMIKITLKDISHLFPTGTNAKDIQGVSFNPKTGEITFLTSQRTVASAGPLPKDERTLDEFFEFVLIKRKLVNKGDGGNEPHQFGLIFNVFLQECKKDDLEKFIAPHEKTDQECLTKLRRDYMNKVKKDIAGKGRPFSNSENNHISYLKNFLETDKRMIDKTGSLSMVFFKTLIREFEELG